VLRNPEDQGVEDVASLSTREMLGHPQMAAAKPSGQRRAVAQPVSQPVAVVHRASPKIRIIRSASVSETPAVADSTN
jgi:hypothetical protein